MHSRPFRLFRRSAAPAASAPPKSLFRSSGRPPRPLAATAAHPPARRHGRCGRGRHGEAAAVRHEASQRGHRAGHRQPAPGEARQGEARPGRPPTEASPMGVGEGGAAGWAPARTPPVAPGRWARELAYDLGQLPALSCPQSVQRIGNWSGGLICKWGCNRIVKQPANYIWQTIQCVCAFFWADTVHLIRSHRGRNPEKVSCG